MAAVGLLTSVVTALKVFFGLESRVAVLETKHDSLTRLIEQGFESIKREIDHLREELRK